MSARGWRDLIVGDRMQVDQEFTGRVNDSSFGPSEWGMIMTAVEFEVTGEGEEAELVADTSNIDVILPELAKMNQRMGVPSGEDDGATGGLLGSLRALLGGGGGPDPQRRQEAASLAEDYATTLQQHLEDRGRWDRVRTLAVEERETTPPE